MPTTWSKMPPDFPLVILWFSARHDLKVDSLCVCLGEGGGGVVLVGVFIHVYAFISLHDAAGC